MPTIPVALPSLLTHCTQGKSTVMIEAHTLAECIDTLVRTYPLLKPHLFDETGTPRPHVLFFYNEENTRWLKDLRIPLRPGDRLTVLQSVSGG